MYGQIVRSGRWQAWRSGRTTGSRSSGGGQRRHHRRRPASPGGSAGYRRDRPGDDALLPAAVDVGRRRPRPGRGERAAAGVGDAQGGPLDQAGRRRDRPGRPRDHPGRRWHGGLRLPGRLPGDPARLGEDHGTAHDARPRRRVQQLPLRARARHLELHPQHYVGHRRLRHARGPHQVRGSAAEDRLPAPRTTGASRACCATSMSTWCCPRRACSASRSSPTSSRAWPAATASPCTSRARSPRCAPTRGRRWWRTGRRHHHDLPYDVMHLVPPQSAPDWIKKSPLADAANPAGYVEIDKNSMQHVRYPDVFSLGDAGILPELQDRSGGPQASPRRRGEPARARWTARRSPRPTTDTPRAR